MHKSVWAQWFAELRKGVMPIPGVLKEAFRSKQFWTGYVLNRDETPEWPAFGRRCRAEVPIGNGYSLVFDLMRSLYWTNLSLLCPRRKRPLWLARDDLAYWPREVLRWPEAELFSRAAAQFDKQLPHPGVVLVLLYRFTPLTAGDDRRVIWSMMRQAFESLNVLSGRAVERCLREGNSDLRDTFAWSEEKKAGWVLQDLSTDRFEHPRAPKSKFPFQDFAKALAAAEQTCLQGPGRRRNSR